jgi:pimeloyl-ACP methyl ester carboxylesterase
MNKHEPVTYASGARLKMPPPKTIDVDGVSTSYHEAGAGEPIVFIYGGNFGTADSAPSAHAWNLNFVPLSDRFHVVAFDKIGQGYTGNPLRDEDYTMAAVVRHAAAFIVAAKLPPVHLVGHSRGGFAAVRVALEYPHLVRSVTIVSSGTLSPRVSTNEVALSKVPFPSYTRDSARWIYQGYCFDPKTVTDDWVDRVYDVLQLPKYKESVRKMVDEACGSRFFTPQLAKQKRETLQWLREGRLQRPTQIVFGNNDPTVATEGAFDIFDLVAPHQRRTEAHIINEAGHFSYREHPERFNALLGGFVDLVSKGWES